jgi:hypothetical protein
VTDQIQLTDIMRRALDANVQYLTAVSKLAAECFQTLVTSATNLSSQERANGTVATSGDAAVASASEAQGPVPTIVLEAEAGGHAMGVFLVENVLSHTVSARIVVSSFVDPSGREVQPPIRIEPETITLESQEQILVRVLAGIEDSLSPATDYRAEIRVPDLPGTRVPLVLRRRSALAANQQPPARNPAAKSKARNTRGNRVSLAPGREARKNRTR